MGNVFAGMKGLNWRFFCERSLFFEEVQVFYLSPNEVSLFYLVGEGVPGSSGDESSDHAGIVTFSDEYFETMFVL